MKNSIGALSALVAVASLLAACNGNGALGPGPSPSSSPSGNCGGPPNQLQVLYPIPGSHNAPDGLANIYVSTKGPLPPSNQFNFFLSQSNSSSTFTGLFGTINPSQIPAPHATPSYPNPTYYASAIAGPYGSSYTIGPDQAVALFWNDGGRNCNPHFLVASFKTK